MPQGKFRSLQLPKAGCRTEHTHRKNSTSRPYPKPTSALWMLTITVQISPPRKLSGVCDTSDQISASLSFQLLRASSRVDTTQLSLTWFHLHFYAYFIMKRLYFIMLGRVNVILLSVLWLTDTKSCVILTVVIELQMLAGPATGGVPAGAPFSHPRG